MTTKIRGIYELSSLVATGSSYVSFSSVPFTFDTYDRGSVGFAAASLASASQVLVMNLQHSLDKSKWDTVHSFGLSATGAAYNFEDNAKQPKPLLPYGRITGNLASTGATAQWNDIVIKFLVDKA